MRLHPEYNKVVGALRQSPDNKTTINNAYAMMGRLNDKISGLNARAHEETLGIPFGGLSAIFTERFGIGGIVASGLLVAVMTIDTLLTLRTIDKREEQLKQLKSLLPKTKYSINGKDVWL